MLSEAFRYPVDTADSRDAFAVCSGLVLVALVLLRGAAALWPDWFAAVPTVLVVFPASLFAGYLGTVLVSDSTGAGAPAFVWSLDAAHVGVRLLVVVGVYLLPAAFALVATAFVLVSGRGGPILTAAATVALLVTVASVYVLPGALSAAARRGLRAGFSRRAVSGLASGVYFYAWTLATSGVVLGWSLLAITRVATVAAVAAAVVFTYAHVVAARLLNEGIQKSPWNAESTPPA